MNTVRKFFWLLVVALALTIAVGVAYAYFSDSGTVDVQVADYTQSVIDKTTNGGAYVSYFGDHDTTFGSSGTGVFDPFVRLQANGTESGYNTNGTVEFDTKTGKWTHAILVSHIPQRPCGPGGSETCFELWNDINENNSKSANASHISLNKVEVYYTSDPNLTGYDFGSAATLQYKFAGDILINDVNQGSGRGDLRYDIPIGSGANQVQVPANCDYGNPNCTTYFVLYSQWGTTSITLNGTDYSSDGGFEEWKVKQYPAITLTKTPSTGNVCNLSNTSVTYTYVVTNNSPGGQAVDGTIVDDNGTPGNAGDDVTVGTFSKLAAGASQTFTQVLTVNGTRTNTATATATDPNGETATATATATVTGHDCTISLTKTPSQTNVCNGSPVTYTYVVTNNSDFYTWSGSLTDDTITLPGGAASFSLSPGQSKTFTASADITGAVTNKATASGAFNDPAGTSASATKSATVTGHVCTISLTKTPSQTNVCNGLPVTYTYVVHNNSDYFTWTGKLTDDTIALPGGAGSFSVAPGADATFTASANITGVVTNKATASGAFNDPAGTSASATKSATVTGHVCTISLTKTPSQTNVCNGSSVEYTYVITNNSGYFTWTGSLTDDKLSLPAGASSFSLSPGESKTFTASANITGAVTNTATAAGAFNDPASTSASASKSATVTGHVCTISLTKTPSVSTVCIGSNTLVTYTYVVTNNSDFFSVSGSVSDDVYGPIGSFGPLAPGASAKLTKVATVNDTVTNTGTATGTFDDPASTSATATAKATVTGVNCAQITPTNTTCSDFASGTAATLSQIQYSLKDGVINQTNPGVFYYWVSVSGSGPFTIDQTNTGGLPYFTLAPGAFAFDSNCNSITSATITQDGSGNVTITGSGIAYIGVKYSTSSVVGQPDPGTVTYSFVLTSDPTSSQSIDLAPK